MKITNATDKALRQKSGVLYLDMIIAIEYGKHIGK